MLYRCYGRVCHTINAARCGDVVTNMLQRLDQDALFYQPHLTLLLVGGAEPIEKDGNRFAEDLRALITGLRDNGSEVALLTYYALIGEKAEPERLKAIERNVNIIREQSVRLQVGLIDIMARWERLRQAQPQQYEHLMYDPLHINRRGNALYGLEVARWFGAYIAENEIGKEADQELKELLRLQYEMDAL
jgi:hypothetical protein